MALAFFEIEQSIHEGKSTWRLYAPAWRELVRKRAMAIATLQGLNACARDFATKIRGGFNGLPLPAECPGSHLLGFGASELRTDAGAWSFLTAAIRLGVVTAAETEKARADAAKLPEVQSNLRNVS